jgi:hypothetical protein
MALEFPHPAGYLQTALQRAVDLVAFGLRASEDAMPVELTIPGSFGHVIRLVFQSESLFASRSAR